MRDVGYAQLESIAYDLILSGVGDWQLRLKTINTLLATPIDKIEMAVLISNMEKYPPRTIHFETVKLGDI